MPRPKSNHPTPGELEVLKILWDRGPSTVRQVMERLNAERPRAYTSVMSLLTVMTEKGLLNRKPQGRAFVYEAVVREDSTLRRMVADLTERVFDGSAQQLVVHLLEQTEPSAAELDEIRQLIDAYRTVREATS